MAQYYAIKNKKTGDFINAIYGRHYITADENRPPLIITEEKLERINIFSDIDLNDYDVVPVEVKEVSNSETNL